MQRMTFDDSVKIVLRIAAFALGFGTAGLVPGAAWAVVTCPSSGNSQLPEGGDGQDLEVTGTCTVGAGDYVYGNVNVFGTTDRPAMLKFKDARITFSARSILVENFGHLLAGWSTMRKEARPIGTRRNGRLTIRLYGAPTDPPIACKSGPTCGVDPAIWNANADPTKPPVETQTLPGGADYFYNYDFMPFAEGQQTSYFGTKVLAVSYGGTLRMYGDRGALYGDRDDDAADSGRSWRRLKGSLEPGATELVVDGKVDWRTDDHIVVTTTDYLPGHSEELIVTDTSVGGNETTRIRFTHVTCPPPLPRCGVKWHHYGKKYPLDADEHPGIGRLDLNIESIDTRAAVALLSRSIRIVSAGDTPALDFPSADTRYAHGGHTLVRQGFKAFQMQGVELHQLGQGGRIGYYPVHFHMVRKTPDETFVKDSSIHDSMTRWITLHATQGVLLARNVGYMSIGHGYYIEDGTETDNKLYSNIGIMARAAVDNSQNPRKVPGILSARFTDRQHAFPYHSDAEQPTVFWIMNGWNDFRHNFAVGAGGCGSCYWLLPGYNSGRENTRMCYNPTTARYGPPCMVDVNCVPPAFPEPGFTCAPYSRMAWKGYAAMQSNLGRAGTTPLEKFVGNSCTSAMNSFPTVGELGTCNGVAPLTRADDKEHLAPIENPLAPAVQGIDQDLYYPRVVAGASRPATRCGANPKKVSELDCGNDAMFLKCGSNPSPPLPPPENRPITNCMVTVLNRYTTSFNWADTNFAAVWLRQFWYVFSNSAITDVQNGGLTFVTGGDYTRSSVIDGYWAVAAKSAFVGRTQPDVGQDPAVNPYASAAGPFNPRSGLQCPINDASLSGPLPNHCIAADDGVDFEVANFATNQRLFSIYDGPSYQDSNAYLDIEPTKLPELTPMGCQPSGSNACPGALKLYARDGGVPKDATSTCYLPNAAIGWKQPNGFFYPPAFHSRNLYFDNAAIRHFVIQPEFTPGTLVTDPARVADRYCTYPIVQNQALGLFNGFTDVDRQTVLNDDDGSLTGLVAKPKGADRDAERETISVNFDSYFNAPIEAVECGSDVANPPMGFPPGTAKTSPYEYLTTAVYPACARLGGPQPPDSEPACGYRVTPPDPVTPEPVQNPSWWSDCTAGTCYGVPLYRQGLNSTERMDGTQAIRMMGANLWQRSTLTANNGIYYLDTTAGSGKQAATPNKNIFEENRTYYLLFVYATPSTHQMYQLYLKPGLAANYADRNVFLTRVFPNVSHFDFRDDFQTWPPGWVRAYDTTKGILTVTIDMGFEQFRKEFEQAREDFCQPPSFCTFSGNRCRCNDDGDFEKICKDNDICGRWAGKDIDWPAGGVYGFGVRFPDGFVADDQDHRPAPPPGGCVRQTDAGWDVPLVYTKDALRGACKGTPISPRQFCAP
jgi:hypothetical protein